MEVNILPIMPLLEALVVVDITVLVEPLVLLGRDIKEAMVIHQILIIMAVVAAGLGEKAAIH